MQLQECEIGNMTRRLIKFAVIGCRPTPVVGFKSFAAISSINKHNASQSVPSIASRDATSINSQLQIS